APQIPGAGSAEAQTANVSAGKDAVAPGSPSTTPQTALPNAIERDAPPDNTAVHDGPIVVQSPPRAAPQTKSGLLNSPAKQSTIKSAAKPIEPTANLLQQSGFVPPKLLRAATAVATLDDIRDFERGSVVVDAVVDISGAVTSLNVLSGPPSLRLPAL